MLTPALLVDNLAEKVDECLLNQGHVLFVCTLGSVKVSFVQSSGVLSMELNGRTVRIFEVHISYVVEVTIVG